MNVKILEDKLYNNPDNIMKVMVGLGFQEQYIKYHKHNNFISSRRLDPNADNNMGFILYCDNTCCMETTRNYRGNIFTLVMKYRHVEFPQSLNIIASILGVSDDTVYSKQTHHPFPSLQKILTTTKEYPELSVETYQDSKLPPADSLSLMYLKDGVSLQVQEKRGIRYDHENDVIIIPIFSLEGRLMGAKARSNNPRVSHDKRFYAAICYAKTLTLYGYSWNYGAIIKHQLVIIVEAEKSELQAESFGCFLCLAIGGHSISETQARYIKGLYVKNVIVAFDSDVLEDDIKFEANKLINGKSNIYYTYDADEKYMKKKDKISPTDRGKKMFEKIIHECRRKL